MALQSQQLMRSIGPLLSSSKPRTSFLSEALKATQRRTAPHRATMAGLAMFKTPKIENEPNKHYAKGSAERTSLANAVNALKQKSPLDISPVVDGKTIKGTGSFTQPNPSSHADAIAKYSGASPADIDAAIESALAAKPEWEALPFADRAAVFLKAADLISTKYRYDVMAATMLGQGKNAWQAEIDSAAELCDFFRFHVHYAEQLYNAQPVHNAPGVWNRVEYRPLEGFVYAVTPFNFTAIAGNLPGAPALMGNVVLWKPSPSAIASNHLVYKILLEAGLPPNVIQFVPGDAESITTTILAHPKFAALHYTGSTAVFRSLYGKIAHGVSEGRYESYPRIVGETGGKNFHILHPTADLSHAVINTVRGAFEFQGQKCSACSRVYVPESLYEGFKTQLVEETKNLQVGEVGDFQNFIGPVIHEQSFEKLRTVIDEAKSDNELELLVGGTYDKSQGFFIHPTIYVTKNPNHPLLARELFGPVLVAYVYPDDKFFETCAQIDRNTSYALTGAVFANDRRVIRQAEEALRDAAGNFYINTKCTGAVVGQQPFGGARGSGTNDKAGSVNLLMRFVSQRAVKEQFTPDALVTYPSNEI